MRRTLAALALMITLSGCAPGGTPVSTPSNSTPGTPAPSVTTPGSAPSGVPDARWTAILDDLTGRGAPTDAVELVSARSVTWNNGALGCPKPGRSYTQALVQGMQVVVRAGDREYDYRFGNGDRPKLCERG
nr:hypothetical protein [Propionicimonas sp.]